MLTHTLKKVPKTNQIHLNINKETSNPMFQVFSQKVNLVMFRMKKSQRKVQFLSSPNGGQFLNQFKSNNIGLLNQTRYNLKMLYRTFRMKKG